MILRGVVPGRKAIPDIEIVQITPDSRKVKKDALFVAYMGVAVDGHDFITQAIASGAVAVVGEKSLKFSVPYFQVSNGRLTWAKMTANLYGNPEKKLTIIGVTGTDGKTTTTNLIYQMLLAAGIKVAMVSTIKAMIAGKEFDTGLHTSSPDPDILWGWLSQIAKAGQTHVVLETTSHGLVQYRFGDIKFDVGVLTNLAHDHLEFHKTIEAYRDAKALLFANSLVSVINDCSAEADFFKSKAVAKAISYDVRKDVRSVSYIEDMGVIWQEFEIMLNDGWKKVRSKLLGEYNLENVLAASITAREMGASEKDILQTINKFDVLPGRFQVILNERGLRTIVDFAHTEQGLSSVIGLVKNHLRKNGEKIIVVFGCNGGRDQTKRAPMGKTACELADLVVVTVEDPRKEPVEEIYKQIEEGCLAGGGIFDKTFFREDDRATAINMAINKLANKGDWILFLGKGHEKSMNIGGAETPWDEVVQVKESLKKK
jgi:UDP-N-acetylmuramoyl-L-alanyl-D-glutamate--2,6-diaminopimelate ligase